MSVRCILSKRVSGVSRHLLLDHLYTADLSTERCSGPFVSLPRTPLPHTQPHLAQQSSGRGGLGNIERSSLSRRVYPTHTDRREPEVGVPSLRIPRTY